MLDIKQIHKMMDQRYTLLEMAKHFNVSVSAIKLELENNNPFSKPPVITRDKKAEQLTFLKSKINPHASPRKKPSSW